ncbi:MAG: hypothetical protein JO354_02625 [Verrucomicrobia bacterium]|nr:hypothetical protein [Verrucomicrobiota bacterium]
MALPDLALVAVAHGIGGIGAGLLLSQLLRRNARRTLGATLLAVGILAKIPLVLRLRSQLD